TWETGLSLHFSHTPFARSNASKRVAKLLPLGQFIGVTGLRSTFQSCLPGKALICPVCGGKISRTIAFFPTNILKVFRLRFPLCVTPNLPAFLSRLIIPAILDFCFLARKCAYCHHINLESSLKTGCGLLA